ncbi:MAG TPA: four helix bundle protein [Byssovorax sp.]
MLRIYADALVVLQLLKPTMVEIGRHDSDLARQLRRCGASMVLNIAEGSYARMGNQKALFAVALGSAKETRACVDVVTALGYVGGVEAGVEARLERIGGVLYRLTHR